MANFKNATVKDVEAVMKITFKQAPDRRDGGGRMNEDVRLEGLEEENIESED